MGNACASTTLQGPTASTAPRCTTISLGRLLMARLEPPGSVSVSSQSGMVSPDPCQSEMLPPRVPFSCVSESSTSWGGGEVLSKQLSSEEALAHPCPAPTMCVCGQDSPVCTAPHLAILMRPRCLLVWPFSGMQVHLLGVRSATVGSLQPTRVPWSWQGAGFVLSMDTLTNTFAGGMTFSCWVWALLTPGHWGQEQPWALEVCRSVLQCQGGCLGRVLRAGECRGHGAMCFSKSSSLGRRMLRTPQTTPGRLAGLLSAILPWLQCYPYISNHQPASAGCGHAHYSMDDPWGNDSEFLLTPAAFDEQALE